MSNKSKFYTSIEIRGGNILYRGYEDGLPVQQKIAYNPHLFVRTEEPSEYTVFDTDISVKKKTFHGVSEMKSFVETYEDIHNFGVYGCTDMVRQFTANTFRGEIEWSYYQTQIWFFDIETRVTNGFPHPDKAQEEILLISMINHGTKRIHVWSILPANKNNKIFTKYPDIDFRYFADEKSMLKDLVMFFRNTRIDILSGWYSEIFDLPYIVNRIKKVLGEQVADYLSPWKNVKERSIRYENGETKQSYDISGITHLDYLELYKKFNPGSKEEFGLGFICELELGETKVENPYESFAEFYEKDPQLFIEYNVHDAMLLHKLENKKMQIRLAMQLGFMAKCQFADVVSAMRLWESIIYNYFLDNNIVEKLGKESNERRKIAGGYVHDPVPGKRKWVFSLDYTSMYPSIVMQNNISPECIVGFDESITPEYMLENKHVDSVPMGNILSANGLLTSKEVTGFIPILIKRMFDLRKKTKNDMLELKKQKELEKTKGNTELADKLATEISVLDVAQQAFKVAANSFYGILLLPYFKYYDYRMGEAITTVGQVFIKKSKEYVDVMLRKICGDEREYVFYLDTDSAYCDVTVLVDRYCKNKTDAEVVDFIEKFVSDTIQPKLNDKLKLVANSMGADTCLMYMKLECIGKGHIQVAKKRYIFDILYSEGVRYAKPQTKVMGIEIVRSSTPSVVKGYLSQAVKICLDGTQEQLIDKIKDIKLEFFKQDYVKIAFPRGVNGLSTYSSDASIYGKQCPIAVRGALLYNHHLKRLNLDAKYPSINEGDKIKFVALKMPNTIHENVIAFPTKIPVEFKLNDYIDYETQFTKSFLDPISSILTSIGWTAEHKITLDFE